MSRMIIGVFNERASADSAINELRDFGISAKDISIIMKDSPTAKVSTGSSVVGGAASGATTGGVLGGLAGLLIGVGAIAIPGIGALLIGGPLAAALGFTGAVATTISGAVTGALAGGLVGALVGWGVPEEEAKVLEQRVREGAILLAIPVNELNEEETREILEAHGADQIRSVGIPSESIRREEDDLEDEGVYRPAYFEEIRRRRGK